MVVESAFLPIRSTIGVSGLVVRSRVRGWRSRAGRRSARSVKRPRGPHTTKLASSPSTLLGAGAAAADRVASGDLARLPQMVARASGSSASRATASSVAGWARRMRVNAAVAASASTMALKTKAVV